MIGGDYDKPKVRLPGAGGAPEIAALCGEVVVIVRQNERTFREKVDFVTSVGYGDGPGSRERLGLPGKGPVKVITDLGVLEPDPETCELTMTQLHQGVDIEQAREATGWELKVADEHRHHRPAERRGARRAARPARHAEGGGGMSGANGSYVLDAVRTPIGKLGGALSGVRPDDLAAHIVKSLVERSPDLDPAEIEDVYFGDANGAGEDNRDVARMAVLLAGLPTSIPGATVNRLCGSGLEAAIDASRAVVGGRRLAADRRAASSR